MLMQLKAWLFYSEWNALSFLRTFMVTKPIKTVCMMLAALTLSSCATQSSQEKISVNSGSRWVLLPIINRSQSPQAGERVEAILSAKLRAKGLSNFREYPQQRAGASMLLGDGSARYEKAEAWAKQGSFDYYLTGSVEEWSYKAGLDGEPAVGVSLKLIDPKTAKVVWSASGARVGWGREAVSMTAHKLLGSLLSGVRIDR